jgi:hypothetical protein
MKQKERKHKYGKRNRQRIAAGLPPVSHTPLQPDASGFAVTPCNSKSPSPSVLAIQAAVIEELQRVVDDLKSAYLANLTLRPTENK